MAGESEKVGTMATVASAAVEGGKGGVAGGGIGAVVGAIVGAITGRSWGAVGAGAAVGTTLGGVAGGGIGAVKSVVENTTLRTDTNVNLTALAVNGKKLNLPKNMVAGGDTVEQAGAGSIPNVAQGQRTV